MTETYKGPKGPFMISWAIRGTAGLLLVYMLALMTAEIAPWLATASLFSPDRSVEATSLVFLIIVSNMLLWPVWCGLVNRGLQPLAQPQLKTKPIMAALWFLFPGAFLFMPWPVVREIYLASENPLEWEDRKAPIVGWWWCLRVIFYFSIWPLSTLADAGGDGFGRALMFQVIIVVELALQIIMLTRMTRWLGRPLNTTVADVF